MQVIKKLCKSILKRNIEENNKWDQLPVMVVTLVCPLGRLWCISLIDRLVVEIVAGSPNHTQADKTTRETQALEKASGTRLNHTRDSGTTNGYTSTSSFVPHNRLISLQPMYDASTHDSDQGQLAYRQRYAIGMHTSNPTAMTSNCQPARQPVSQSINLKFIIQADYKRGYQRRRNTGKH